MGKSRKVAYCVFRGNVPGVYYSWEECEQQVKGYSKAKFIGFEDSLTANQAWEEWNRKINLKMVEVPRAAITSQCRAGTDNVHSPTVWVEPDPDMRTCGPSRNRKTLANSDAHLDYSNMLNAKTLARRAASATAPQASSPVQQSISNSTDSSSVCNKIAITPLVSSPRQHVSSSSSLPNSSPFLGFTIDTTGDPSLAPQARQNLKRAASYVDLTNDSEEEGGREKRLKKQLTPFDESTFSMESLQHGFSAPTKSEEKTVRLTAEQEKVVKLAMRGENLFLTGAAGSGKTVTLKEIIRRLEKRKKRVQVIAPTGIAALPLGGKTIQFVNSPYQNVILELGTLEPGAFEAAEVLYKKICSFAGWNPDSLRKPIVELLKKSTKRVIKEINALDVLIIEEISMVENQFLERLNLLFQNVMKNHREVWSGDIPSPITDTPLPFGGKQVIFLGDFHQLPPVLPFQFCMNCGNTIPKGVKPACISQTCKGMADSTFNHGDKWAFRAAVWTALGLRHVKLEQIHRQKDTRFQDILNKIRNGSIVTPKEWLELEKPKQLPYDALPVRLMSRLAQVKWFNDTELAKLPSILPKNWAAIDACIPLAKKTEQQMQNPILEQKAREHQESLKDHRFPTNLTLKIGARVVLLYNLDHTKGLVNGSQGKVVGFQASNLVLETELRGDHADWRVELIRRFQLNRSDPIDWRPYVRFANGVTTIIPAIASVSVTGGSHVHEQYLTCRTQIPLTLAWALSIHKSQGMTLEYVEVSSKDIFESGQLYVALSRATELDGLSLTGFSRQQLPMDRDVLNFYQTTDWEKLEPRRRGKLMQPS